MGLCALHSLKEKKVFFGGVEGFLKKRIELVS